MNTDKALYIIDENFKIRYTSKHFGEYYPDVSVGAYCYEAVGGREEVCHDCPVFSRKRECTVYNQKRRQLLKTDAVPVEWKGNDHCFAICLKEWGIGKNPFAETDQTITKYIEDTASRNPSAGILAQRCEGGLPILYASERLLEMMGYDSYGDFISVHPDIDKHIHPDESASAIGIFGKDYYEGMLYSTTYRLRRRDGSYFWVVDNGQLFKNNLDEFIIISVISDISDILTLQANTELENLALTKHNRLLNYINKYQPGGYHRCKMEPGFPFVEYSTRFTRMLGYSKKDIELLFDNKFINLIHPDDIAVLNEKFARCLERSGDTVDVTYRVKHKKKGYIWVKDSTTLSEYDGEMFYLCTIIDITSEMQTQFSLLEKNRQLEIVRNNIPGGFKINCIEPPYEIVHLSREAAELFGYTVKELLEVSHGSSLELCCDEDRELVREHMKRKLSKIDDGYSVKFRIKCKDGSLKWVIDYGKRGVDNRGRTCFYSFLLDITKDEERENLIALQSQLIEQEEKQKKQQEDNYRQLQLIFALSKDYNTVYHLNFDTGIADIIYLSDIARAKYVLEDIYGRYDTFDDRMRLYINTSVLESDRDAARIALSTENIRKLLREKSSFLHTFRAFNGDGIAWFEVKCARVELDGGYNAIVGFRNVTGTMNKEIEQRTLLSDALAEAQAASKAKTAFLNNMSHDIRTPMNAILGFTSLATKHIDNKEKVRGYLDKIMSSSNHLLSLVNDVLDMSRIESGRVRLREDAEDIIGLIENLTDMIDTDLSNKGIHFNLCTDGVTHREVFCDRLRVTQVLINILSNAIKFTGHGGKVELSVREEARMAADYSNYIFTVSDNGIGMGENFLSHIFEPFAREKDSTISGIQGTGLGMSIVKSIIDLLGGDIRVDSCLGKGTTFVVTLPLRHSRDEGADGAAYAESGEIDATQGRGTMNIEGVLFGKRILVVEDNLLNQEITKEILEESGAAVELADNGRIAVDMIEKNGGEYYDIVLMDIQMPEMDGYEAARAIRAQGDARKASVPIVAITANAFEEEKHLAFEAGMNSHIPKPIDISRLIRVIRRLTK